MTKKEIVKDIADQVGLSQQQVKEIVQLTLEAIISTLANDPDHRIELRNFGVFQVKRRAARSARNPRTNEKVRVPAKNVVTFKPGKRMEEVVRNLENVPLLNDDELSGTDEEPSEELATSFSATGK